MLLMKGANRKGHRALSDQEERDCRLEGDRHQNHHDLRYKVRKEGRRSRKIDEGGGGDKIYRQDHSGRRSEEDHRDLRNMHQKRGEREKEKGGNDEVGIRKEYRQVLPAATGDSDFRPSGHQSRLDLRLDQMGHRQEVMDHLR